MQSQMAILTVPQTHIDHIHIRFTCKKYLLMMVFGCEQTKWYKCTIHIAVSRCVCVAQNQTHYWNNHKMELQAKAFSNSCVDHKHWEYPMVIYCLNSICNNDNNQCACVHCVHMYVCVWLRTSMRQVTTVGYSQMTVNILTAKQLAEYKNIKVVSF